MMWISIGLVVLLLTLGSGALYLYFIRSKKQRTSLSEPTSISIPLVHPYRTPAPCKLTSATLQSSDPLQQLLDLLLSSEIIKYNPRYPDRRTQDCYTLSQEIADSKIQLYWKDHGEIIKVDIPGETEWLTLSAQQSIPFMRMCNKFDLEQEELKTPRAIAARTLARLEKH